MNKDSQKIKELENKKFTKREQNIFFGICIVGMFVLSIMFSAQILSGTIALLVLIIFVPLSIWGIKALVGLDPLIRQKTRNETLKAMVKEASKNAIEQLENNLIDKDKAIEKARKTRNEVKGQIETLKKQLEEVDKESKYYSKMQVTLDTFENAYNIVQDRIAESVKSRNDFADQLKEYKQYAKFVIAADKISEALNKEDSLTDMLSTVAFDAIDQKFNTAIADIENSVTDDQVDRA